MIKHNKWIGKIHREGILSKSRYEKLCLDKNERVTNFSKSFFNQFVSKINSKRIIAYPEVWKLYYALANLHRIKTNQLFLTAGIDGAIKNCFELFVAKRGKVITLNPTFAMVDIYCKIFNAKRFNINYNGKLKLNVNYLIQSIDRKTSLVIIANPNSPTGTIIDKIDLEKIIKKANSLNVPVLIDEAYHEFCNMTVLPLVKKYEAKIPSKNITKDNLIKKLFNDFSIKCVTQYYPLYKYPLFKKMGYKGNCTNTEEFYKNMVSFPFHHWMTNKDFEYLISSVKKVMMDLRKYR